MWGEGISVLGLAIYDGIGHSHCRGWGEVKETCGKRNGGLGINIDDESKLTLKLEDHYADGRGESP